jgi:hypothetical protein
MITTLREIIDLIYKLLKKKRLMKMNRMTDRLRDLVHSILCEGIDNPNLYENLTTEISLGVWTVEEVDFCIEWMQKKLGV